MDNTKSEDLIAISEENRSVKSEINFDSQSQGFKNRRRIKLEKKMINRAALETELIRIGRRSQGQGFNERQTITGVFSTLIYDLKADRIENL